MTNDTKAQEAINTSQQITEGIYDELYSKFPKIVASGTCPPNNAQVTPDLSGSADYHLYSELPVMGESGKCYGNNVQVRPELTDMSDEHLDPGAIMKPSS